MVYKNVSSGYYSSKYNALLVKFKIDTIFYKLIDAYLFFVGGLKFIVNIFTISETFFENKIYT